jgi:hypothetical protein
VNVPLVSLGRHQRHIHVSARPPRTFKVRVRAGAADDHSERVLGVAFFVTCPLAGSAAYDFVYG